MAYLPQRLAIKYFQYCTVSFHIRTRSIRSFRKTFKRMCRDAGVGEEVHDAITGHRQSAGASRANYGGMGVPVMFKAISKLNISFLESL